MLFSVTAVLDPSFLALITLVGQNDNIVQNILANVSWIFISQLPMFIMLVAVILNKHEKMINYFKNKVETSKKMKMIKKILYVLLSIIILIAGFYSLTEAVCYFITNTWLF